LPFSISERSLNELVDIKRVMLALDQMGAPVNYLEAIRHTSYISGDVRVGSTIEFREE
jgi:hypothetical protein